MMRLFKCGVSFCSGPFFILNRPLRRLLLIKPSYPWAKLMRKLPSGWTLWICVTFLLKVVVRFYF